MPRHYARLVHGKQRWSHAGDIQELPESSVIFVNENENENGEKRENNEFVNEN